MTDLEAYPDMFVQSQQGKYGLKGVFAPYPAKQTFILGGSRNM